MLSYYTLCYIFVQIELNIWPPSISPLFCRSESTPVTEVEPYIPFNINPTGMQPLLTTSYLLAFPSIMARFAISYFFSCLFTSPDILLWNMYSIFGSHFWKNLKEIMNLRTSAGGSPWVYYLTYAFLVFVFNIFDIVSLCLIFIIVFQSIGYVASADSI